MQLRKKPEKKKKIQELINGVWTRDLAIPVRCSNQLTYQATDVGSWSIMCSYVPVKEMNMIDVYGINHKNWGKQKAKYCGWQVISK